MNWEAIRRIGKMDESELWHPKRTERPILLNNITHAAEGARELLPKFNQAVELLKQVGNSRDELWESTYDELFENIEMFLRELEGSDG